MRIHLVPTRKIDLDIKDRLRAMLANVESISIDDIQIVESNNLRLMAPTFILITCHINDTRANLDKVTSDVKSAIDAKAETIGISLEDIAFSEREMNPSKPITTPSLTS